MLFCSSRAKYAVLLLFPLVRLFPNSADTPSAIPSISQDAVAACQFDLSSTLAQAPVGGGQVKVTVQASLPNCNYAANSNVPWIAVVNVDHATNIVTMVVESNPGLARNGAVTIAGVPFIVTQPSTTRATGARFVAMQPCRVMDTRLGSGKNGPFGIPHLLGQSTRDIPVPAGSCNVPASARAYSVNVTVVPPAPLGFVTLWPTGQPRPTVSTVNSFEGRVVANAAIVPAGVGGGISAFASNDTDIVLDINGYFTYDPRALTGPLGFLTVWQRDRSGPWLRRSTRPMDRSWPMQRSSPSQAAADPSASLHPTTHMLWSTSTATLHRHSPTTSCQTPI